jgi:hypothetical protein
MAKGVKGQTGLQIALQTRNGGRVDGSVFFDKSRHGLISGLTIFLVEQSSQFRFELFLLLGGDITKDIVHLVHHTRLARRVRELLTDGIEHGLVAITHRTASIVLTPRPFRSSSRSFQACSFSRSPTRKASTSLSPLSAMPTKRMEDTRNRRGDFSVSRSGSRSPGQLSSYSPLSRTFPQWRYRVRLDDDDSARTTASDSHRVCAGRANSQSAQPSFPAWRV